MKIRTKINLVFISGFLLVILISALAINYFSSRQLSQLSGNLILKLNDAKANQLRTFLRGEQEVVLSLSSSTVFRDFLVVPENSDQYQTQKDIVEKRLTRSVGSVEQIEELFILDKNGKIVASTIPANDGTDKSTDPFFTEGKNGVYIKSFYFSDVIKANAYAVSAPILDDKTKELLGVVVARMYPDNLYATVGADLSGTKTGENFLIDSNLLVISPSRYLTSEDVLNKKIDTQNARDCFTPQEIASVTAEEDAQNSSGDISDVITARYTDYRGVQILGAHHYIPEAGWCLITKEDLSEALAPSASLSLIIILISVIILIIFIPIAFYVSAKMAKNIRALQKGAQSVEKGNLDQKVALETKDEIGQLSQSLQKMIESLKDARQETEQKIAQQTKEINKQKDDLEIRQKAILNILEDVEEEKNVSKNLAKDLEKFKQAVDYTSNHIVITDPEGITLYANHAVEEITGFKISEVLGKKAGNKELWGGLMEKGDYEKMWKIIKTDKKTYIGEVNNRRKNGKDYVALANISPVLDQNGQVVFFVGIERDITKEKEIDKAKTEFVSLASHQLRTPLSAINWYTEMLLAGDAGKINKEQKNFLGEIYNGNKRMVDLVNALLNVSRIDLGTFAIEPKPSDLKEISDIVIAELLPDIKVKKIKIKKEYDATIPILNVDPNLTKILFQNLLSNAVKYTPEKGSISLLTKKQDKDILITVTDTGYGIPKESQAKIFTKLYRADNVREKDANGTGLGLYLVKAIAESSGGKIWFESEENKGTTFYVTIPLGGMKEKSGTKGLTMTV